MKAVIKRPLLTIIVFLALIGLIVGITAAMIRPPGQDLLVLAGFLFLSGGVTLGLSVAVSRSRLPSWIRSLHTQLLFISAIVATLVVINIGFVGYLMFIEAHDIGLLVGLIVFSLGLSVMASIYLAQPTSRSVNELIEAARQINTGNLGVTVPVTSRDEIGELAGSFNAMVSRLRESLERERNLETARGELIQTVSHDLRTPLSSIRAMIESINDGVVTDEATIRRYLGTAQSEIENLGQLVNDLFELSQIDAGLLKLHTDAVSLQQLIPDAVASLTAQAAAQRLSLTSRVEEKIPPVTIDSHRVQRVLYNLVQNAIRHTPPDGSISITATDVGDAVEISVADTGEGIPAEDLDRVFERSFRSDHSRSRQSGGAGLGLSISRGIVEAHGGRIRVESQPGGGSIFSFTLPKGSPAG